MVAGPSSVLVRIINITSPASFYVTFPHGMRNILTIREDSRRQDSVSAEYRELFESLQEDASKKVRKSWRPAPWWWPGPRTGTGTEPW